MVAKRLPGFRMSGEKTPTHKQKRPSAEAEGRWKIGVEETTKRLLFVDHFVSGCRCSFDFPELGKRAEAGRLHIAGAAAGDSQKGEGGGGKCGDDANHDGIYDVAEFRRWERSFRIWDPGEAIKDWAAHTPAWSREHWSCKPRRARQWQRR